VNHDDARLHLSARADGEAHDAPGLDAHLASCEDCRAYADGLARLTTLARALPREQAPRDLPRRVASRLRRRRLRRYVPAVALATAGLVALTVLPSGTGTFAPPPAAAAEPLRTLRSLYLERTVTGGPEGDVTERIWFRAPASVRVERTTGGVTHTRIETPGVTYEDGLTRYATAPGIPLPEPLSPTVLLLGTDTGPGPVIAGRATRRVQLQVAGAARIAYVDTERALALGGEEVLVLGKQGGAVTKRVTRVDRDPVIPDETFVPPREATRVDDGFRARRLDALSIDPARLPEGFEPVLVGSGPSGESALFADGSLPLLVTTAPTAGGDVDVRAVERGRRTYLVTLDLYAPPTVEFLRAGVSVKVTAPLPVESLLDIADRMYPE